MTVCGISFNSILTVLQPGIATTRWPQGTPFDNETQLNNILFFEISFLGTQMKFEALKAQKNDDDDDDVDGLEMKQQCTSFSSY